MEMVVVERSFEEPINVEDLQASEKRAQWCLQLHHVEFLHSYVSADRRRLICVYRAPDAESVRAANATARLPFERVWTASVFKP
jgi:hypothetical protein